MAGERIRAGRAPARARAALCRAGAALAAALLAATMLFAPGCAGGESANEQAARQAAEDILARIDQGDVETAMAYLDAAWFDVSVYGVSDEDFVAAFFATFSYEVGEADELSDGSVGVELWFSTLDGAQFEDALRDAYSAAYAAGEAPDAAEAAAEASSVETGEDDPYLLYLVEDDGGSWVVENEGGFGAALLGGYDPRQEMD